MEFEKLKYSAKEHWRQKGWWYFTWRLLVVFVLAMWLWPNTELPAHRDIEDVETTLDDGPKDWHNAPSARRDLRKILTATQSRFYWDSFNWMMEYGKPLKVRNFESHIINLSFAMSEPFDLKPRQRCRSFREKMVVTAKSNLREGIACQRGIADWCKQVEGEKMQCRDKKPSGLEAITGDVFGTHNLNVDLNRQLHKLPKF